MELLIFILIAAIILLIVASFYLARKASEYNDTYNHFIEELTTVYGFIKVQSEVSRELALRQVKLENFSEFFKQILDVHAHALKLGALNWPNESIIDKTQNPENFGG